jgi:hypothetical protein
VARLPGLQVRYLGERTAVFSMQAEDYHAGPNALLRRRLLSRVPGHTGTARCGLRRRRLVHRHHRRPLDYNLTFPVAGTFT